jgi:hypothetical protein
MNNSSRSAALVATVCFLALAAVASAAGALPAGTILPVSLSSTISSAKCHTGQIVTARVMQDVPLADRSIIPAGAKVIGHIVDVQAASNGSPASITLRFDTLHWQHGTIAIMTNLRAIASFVAVGQAQIPIDGPDRGTPANAWTTEQIGGDTVYRGGGPVEGQNGKVGVPVGGGVLSRLNANPDRGCRAETNANDAPQALWVFSSDACGVYGLPNLEIRNAGRTSGEIVLSSRKGSPEVHAGSGMLLRVNASAASGA